MSIELSRGHLIQNRFKYLSESDIHQHSHRHPLQGLHVPMRETQRHLRFPPVSRIYRGAYRF